MRDGDAEDLRKRVEAVAAQHLPDVQKQLGWANGTLDCPASRPRPTDRDVELLRIFERSYLLEIELFSKFLREYDRERERREQRRQQRQERYQRALLELNRNRPDIVRPGRYAGSEKS